MEACYERFVLEFERLVRQHGPLRMLVDVTALHGMATFFKPFTIAVVRYFDHVAAAEAWSLNPRVFCRFR